MTGPGGAMPQGLQSLLDSALERRGDLNQLRLRRIVRPLDAVHVEIDDRVFTNFCSNDYLGLTHHPRVIAAMQEAAANFGAGTGAAGLISGYTAQHAAAERAVADWKGVQAAIILPSGYQANHAAIQTLSALGGPHGGGIRFLLDKRAHASLVDAVRGSGTPWRVYPHNGWAKLERLLADAAPGQLQIVVTESIFSMDGDAVALDVLAKLKEHHPFVLLLDEAHGSGVYGRHGAGWAAECGLADVADVSIVTFSKAAGCLGGAICSSGKFRDAIVNFGRAYIYSTSIAPAMAAGIEASLAVMRDEPHRQRRLRELSRKVRAQLKEAGLGLPEGDSPIIPIVVGDEKAALDLAEKLSAEQLLVQAVRPPTVPPATSRLRITLSCEHGDEEVAHLVEVLLRQTLRPGGE